MQDESILKINGLERDACIKLFESYQKQNKEIY